MGGNLRLCSNTQKATPYRGGIQNSPSEKEWAVERDTEKQKVHQKDKAGMLFFCKTGCTSVLYLMKSLGSRSLLFSPLLIFLSLPSQRFVCYHPWEAGRCDYIPNLH